MADYDPQLGFLSRVLDAYVDLENENFKDTPKRWLKYLTHYLQKYDPKEDLSKAFTNKQQNERNDKYAHAMVIQVGIPYRACCAHHLLPVLGTAQVGYIPREKVVGLSKLARVVYGFSHATPSLQEDIGNHVVDALMEHLNPLGAMCVISATHGCMECRGVEEPNVATVTSSLRGVFKVAVVRQEFYSLCQIQAHP